MANMREERHLHDFWCPRCGHWGHRHDGEPWCVPCEGEREAAATGFDRRDLARSIRWHQLRHLAEYTDAAAFARGNYDHGGHRAVPAPTAAQ